MKFEDWRFMISLYVYKTYYLLVITVQAKSLLKIILLVETIMTIIYELVDITHRLRSIQYIYCQLLSFANSSLNLSIFSSVTILKKKILKICCNNIHRFVVTVKNNSYILIRLKN